MPLQIRRGTDIERQAITPAAGELIFVTNTNQLYVGNGSTPGGILATGYTNNDAQDAAAAIFTANSPAHSSINFAYNTSTNLITATVDLSDYQGVIRADAFKGSVFADDGSTVGGTELVNAVDGSINLDGTVKGDVIPDQNEAYDLGSSSNRFKDLYLSGTSLYLGSAQITASGAAVDLPAGSTINGVLISDIESGVAAGSDYNINIVGDDSSSIINSSTRTVTASGGFFGNLTGNVTSDNINGTNIIVDSQTTTQNNQFFIINENPNNNSTISIRKNTNAGNFGARMTMVRSRGTNSVPVPVALNDVLSVVSSVGYDGSDFTAGAAITAIVDNPAVSPGIVPASIVFSTMNSSGNLTGRGRFNSNGTFELFQPLFMARTNINDDFMILQQFTTSINDSANVTFTRARGTQTAPIIANPDDAIIDLAAAAFDGVTYTGSSTIRMNIDGAVSSGVVPGRIEFWTADLSGAQTKKAQFNRDGILEVDQIRAYNSSLSITGDLIGSVFSDASTMLVDGTNGALQYYPTTSSNWTSPAPTTVGEALDRLAVVVKALNSGTGA